MPEKEVSLRFRHATEWGKDLEVMRSNGPRRWTGEQLDEVMKQLNAHGLSIVSDAVGSLRFDLVDARRILGETS